MADFFLIVGTILLFLGFPFCVLWTIIRAIKRKRVKKQLFLIVFCFFGSMLLLVIGGFLYSQSDEYKQQMESMTTATVETTTQAETQKETEPTVEETMKFEETTKEIETTQAKEVETKADWEKEYEESDIRYVDIKYLHDNAESYKGEVVISVGEVYDKNDSELQFDTNSKNYFKEITCQFKNKKQISDIKEGDNICFIGKVSEIHTYFGNATVDLENCFIVAVGKDTSTYEKKIKNNSDKENKFVKKAKQSQEDKKNQESKNKKDDYISKCKEYSYENIQRQPNKYDGKKSKISGTVIQVSEGWFDSVTLRVEDSNGNVWYVTYSYSDDENRILENDKITVYGECSGTETYTTILGNSVTIPAIEAKYIDF